MQILYDDYTAFRALLLGGVSISSRSIIHGRRFYTRIGHLLQSCLFQSYAASHAAPTLKQSFSWNFFPTICRPAGSLTSSLSCAETKPTGIVRAG